MLKCFGDLIRETIKAHVDNIIIKSKKVDQLMVDLEKTFKKLRECRVSKYLGYPTGVKYGTLHIC
jgi:hypothetical protein